MQEEAKCHRCLKVVKEEESLKTMLLLGLSDFGVTGERALSAYHLLEGPLCLKDRQMCDTCDVARNRAYWTLGYNEREDESEEQYCLQLRSI